MSYFEDRIYNKMGVNKDDITADLIYYDDRDIDHTVATPLFSEDNHGNIRIIYYGLNRNIIQIPNKKKEDRKTTAYTDDDYEPYYAIRFTPENLKALQAKTPEKEVGKYAFPKGHGTHPWWPIPVIEKYEHREQVDTLVLTEGAFKSFVGARAGIAVIGMTSITCFVDGQTHVLDADISRFIRECHVKNVIILHDGDCMDISEKQLRKGGDLKKRPQGFIDAASATREALLNENVNIYYSYVNTRQLAMDENGVQPKGLDDLLLRPYYQHYTRDIVEELNDVTKQAGRFFVKFNIMRGITHLINHFGLKKVQSFYNMHRSEIAEKPFKFNGTMWKYNPVEDEVEQDESKDLKSYFRVGDYFYKKVLVPNRHNPDILEEVIVPRQKGTIKDDFPKNPHIIEHIARYEAFTVVPDHIRYQEVIHNCYNLYKRISHHGTAGNFPHIDFMMHHIFGEQYELGMDYMQLLFTQPRQVLPILCLVSKERETGKTSFLNLLQEIYSENCVILNNDEIKSNFNSLWAGKLLICMDETALSDNAAMTEKFKMISTAKDIIINSKGKDQVVVANFGKIVLCSNNITNFIYTDEDETRFWVREVPHLPEERRIKDWDDVIRDEVDPFLGYLYSRRMFVSEKRSRMWFHKRDITTEALKRLFREQVSGPEYTLYDWLETYFSRTRTDELWITKNQIRRLVFVNERVNDKRMDKAIKKILKKDKYDSKINDEGRRVTTIYTSIQIDFSDNPTIKNDTDKDRAWHVLAKDVLYEDDYKTLMNEIGLSNRKPVSPEQLEMEYNEANQ